jgi:hypothetical protein
MSSSATIPPVYFELSWSILSSIGLINVLYGILVVGITSLSPISILPIIVSAAGALANGMCYYSFYGEYPEIPTVVTGVCADVMWLASISVTFLSPTLIADMLDRYKKLGCPSTAIKSLSEFSFAERRPYS